MREAYSVGLTDLAVLIWNLYQASLNDRVGFEHCFLSLDQFLLGVNERRTMVTTEELEVLLCAANQLDELNKFFHPTLSFNQLIERLGIKFDRKYNTIKGEIS
ncbi:MAG: hypothetical protein NVS9B9_08620 [Ktedonobacteraceae bacterium]